MKMKNSRERHIEIQREREEREEKEPIERREEREGGGRNERAR